MSSFKNRGFCSHQLAKQHHQRRIMNPTLSPMAARMASLSQPAIPAHQLIDFASNACNRPEILDQAFYSLSQMIRGVNLRDCRLFINVDPMPNADNIEENVRVAEKYFGEVIWNVPRDANGEIAAKGNFPRAFKWCMDQITRPYCFYVQDDWLFVQEFNVMTLINLIKDKPQVAAINLFKIDTGASNSFRIYLSPSMFKTGHFKKITKMLIPDYSPEKQLRPMHPQRNPYPYGGRILKTLGYYGVCYRKNRFPMVRDLGRPWMKKQGLRKHGGIYNNFNTWAPTR